MNKYDYSKTPLNELMLEIETARGIISANLNKFNAMSYEICKRFPLEDIIQTYSLLEVKEVRTDELTNEKESVKVYKKNERN